MTKEQAEKKTEILIESKIKKGLQRQMTEYEKRMFTNPYLVMLMRIRVEAAADRWKRKVFGKCTCCGDTIPAMIILGSDYARPYCDKCNAGFMEVQQGIHKQLSIFKNELENLNRSLKETMKRDSVKAIGGGDIVDRIPPDTTPIRRQIEIKSGEIAQCEEVLAMIASGKYDGCCLDCGESFDQKRLRSKPYAKLCIDCRKELENLQKRNGVR